MREKIGKWVVGRKVRRIRGITDSYERKDVLRILESVKKVKSEEVDKTLYEKLKTRFKLDIIEIMKERKERFGLPDKLVSKIRIMLDEEKDPTVKEKLKELVKP